MTFITISTDKWTQRYLALAAHVATWSKDPSTKVGAIIVSAKNRQLIAVGYNGLPSGLADTPERLADRSTKYALTVHAERAVLDNASFDVEGATLVSTLHPCAECAKSIIAKRLRRVVTRPAPDREPWAESAQLAASMLAEAGVELVVVPTNPLT